MVDVVDLADSSDSRPIHSRAVDGVGVEEERSDRSPREPDYAGVEASAVAAAAAVVVAAAGDFRARTWGD